MYSSQRTRNNMNAMVTVPGVSRQQSRQNSTLSYSKVAPNSIKGTVAQAEQEKMALENRLRYLANEEQKYSKKISKAKLELDRRNQIKASKIEDLQMMVAAKNEQHKK